MKIQLQGPGNWMPAFSVALTALHTLPGCRPETGQVNPQDCRPVSRNLAAGASASGIAGKYRVTLVRPGAEQRQTASGDLTLEPYAGELRRRTRPDGSVDSTVLYPAFGAADVDLSAVGALEVGSTTSRDPTRPGVLVMERHTGSDPERSSQIILRLGAAANHRGEAVRYDGGYTALHVREIESNRFAGDWVSGSGVRQVRGYFCAVKRR